MSREVKVTFEPSGRTVDALRGTILLEAAARAGLIIDTPCGGAGRCGKCLVRVTSGAVAACPTEQTVVPPEKLAEGWRLACQCRTPGPVTVFIPETSLFRSSQKILLGDTGSTIRPRPAVRSVQLLLPSVGREHLRSDLDRLRAAVGSPVEMELTALRDLPGAAREADGSLTLTLVNGTVVEVRSGLQPTEGLGVALDIGTTTLVATLVDTQSGVERAVVGRINPQTAFGDDVISRIRKCREEPHGLEVLHEAIVGAVNEMLQDLARQASVPPERIIELVFAGNSTMQQIFCGISPAALGEIPFAPAFTEGLRLRASELGLRAHPNAQVYVFPQIGGFVGGDTVAGIVATRLDRSLEPSLLVDVGTNGEIVLAARGRLMATSVAAGPAFEGARILQGMRAVAGAIEKVVLDHDVRINVIGNVRPVGLCGTGLIDAVALLLRTGVLDPTGRILSPVELGLRTPKAVRRRLVEAGGQWHFRLADAAHTAHGQPILLHQRDVREVQLANAAIRAGIRILLGMAGLSPSDLGSVLLAGAFGNFIRRSNAVRIGMLPAIPTERIRFVGNTSSLGAKAALLSLEEREYAERVSRQTEHVDLSLHPEFLAAFSETMMFPEEGEASAGAASEPNAER